MIVSATLFNNDGSQILDNLVTASNIVFQEQLNDTGSFSFSIDKDDPAINYDNIIIGNIVKFAVGANTNDFVFAGVIETVVIDASSGNTGYGRTINVSGRGVLALLENAIIYPSNMVDTVEVLTYTDRTPGWVLNKQLYVAGLRGTLGYITPPDLDLDYYATPYATNVTLELSIGTNFLEVAKSIIETSADVWINHQLELCIANARGQNTSDLNIFRIGRDIAGATIEKATPFFNKLLTKYGKVDSTHTIKYLEVQNGSSESQYGNKESFIYFDKTRSATTATNASNKVLNLSKTPTDAITVETLPTATLWPFSNYSVGDVVSVEYLPNEFAEYRVNSITISVNGDGSITVIPEFGSMRQTLDIRLNKALNKLEGSSSGSASAIAASQILSTGGSGEGGTNTAGEIATVLTYVNSTNIGTASLGTTTINFINGTAEFLNIDDTILVFQDTAGDYVAVSKIVSGPALPSTVPPVIFSPTFPIDLTGATYPLNMGNLGSGGAARNVETFTVDKTGNFSGYPYTYLTYYSNIHPGNTSDGYYSRNIVGLVTSSGTSLDLGITNPGGGGYTQKAMIAQNGRAYTIDYMPGYFSGQKTIWYKNNAADTWHAVFNDVEYKLYNGVDGVGFDYKTGYIWFLTQNVANVFSLYYMSPTDTTPHLFSPGIAMPNGCYIKAGNGKVLFYNWVDTVGGYTVYVKNANDTSALTSTYTSAIGGLTNNSNGAIGSDGALYYMGDYAGYIHIYKIHAGAQISHNTGISTTDAMWNYVGVADSGTVIFNMVVKASYFGAGPSNKYLPAVAVSNMYTTAIPFYDPSLITSNTYTNVNSAFIGGASNSSFCQPVNGTMTWVGSSENGVSSSYYSQVLYQLTGL